MLYTDDFDKHLPKLLSCFQGAYALDELPKAAASRPSCLIVNSDKTHRRGEHWMGICFPPSPSTSVLFIEPYALPLYKTLTPIRIYLEHNSNHVQVLPFAIQNISSTACGHFCAFILAHLPSYQYRLNILASQVFSDVDYHYNEAKVERWWAYNVL